MVIIAGIIREDLRATLRTARGQIVGTLLVAKVRASSPRYLQDAQARVQQIVGVTGAAWVGKLPGARVATQEFAIEPPSDGSREIDWTLPRSGQPHDLNTGGRRQADSSAAKTRPGVVR